MTRSLIARISKHKLRWSSCSERAFIYTQKSFTLFFLSEFSVIEINVSDRSLCVYLQYTREKEIFTLFFMLIKSFLLLLLAFLNNSFLYYFWITFHHHHCNRYVEEENISFISSNNWMSTTSGVWVTIIIGNSSERLKMIIIGQEIRTVKTLTYLTLKCWNSHKPSSLI